MPYDIGTISNECSSLEEFAEKYPDEFDAYVDDMYELYGHEDPVDYPEDWSVA